MILRWVVVLILGLILLPVGRAVLRRWFSSRRTRGNFASHLNPQMRQATEVSPTGSSAPVEGMMSIVVIEPHGLLRLAERGQDGFLPAVYQSDLQVHTLIKQHGGWVEASLGGITLCRIGGPGADPSRCAHDALALARAVAALGAGQLSYRVAISTGVCSYPALGVLTLSGRPVLRAVRMTSVATADSPIVLDVETRNALNLTHLPQDYLEDEVRVPVFRLSNETPCNSKF